MSADKYQNRSYEWFVERIGKKVFRKKKESLTEVVVRDQAHACFLLDEQIDFKFKYSEEK